MADTKKKLSVGDVVPVSDNTHRHRHVTQEDVDSFVAERKKLKSAESKDVSVSDPNATVPAGYGDKKNDKKSEMARWDVTDTAFDRKKLAEWREANPDTPIVIVASGGVEHVSRSAATDSVGN